MYSDCFINFMIRNIFCNPAAVVRFLCLCSGAYALINTFSTAQRNLGGASCVSLLLLGEAAAPEPSPAPSSASVLFENNIKMQFA